MNSGLLAKRYATALERYGSECTQADECLENARALLAALPALGEYLGKRLPSAQKMELLKKAVPAIFLGILLALCIMSFLGYGIPYIISMLNA